jgi:acetoacetyl-CoA synthetase
MALFVVLSEGVKLCDALRSELIEQIRSKASARHIPSEVFQVQEVPRTLSGKKMEVPIRKLLLGMAVEKVASPDAMANPGSLEFFVQLAKQLNPTGAVL